MISGFKYAVGIDVGATSIKIGLVNSDWQIIERRIIWMERYNTPDKFFASIKDDIDSMLSDWNLVHDDLTSIGIGLPGCVDSVNGIVRDLTNIRGWGEVNVHENMKKILGVPSYIDNDVNLMTVGEWIHGAGKGCKDMFCCTLGTGVGGGIVMDGKIYRGSTLCAGEIGHISLFLDGEKCNCGNKGCLERYVGNNAIVKRTVAILDKTPDQGDILLRMIDGDLSKLTPKMIFEAAKNGDTVSNFIWKETGYYIGVAFTSLVNILNPEKIVVGGGVAQAGDILFDPIIETVKKYAMPVATKNLKIVPAMLGEDAGIMGAATYSLMRNSNEESVQ